MRNWADALRLQGHYEQAAEKFREAIGIDPEFPYAYNSLGLALAAQERFDDAIEQYRKADELWQKSGSKDRKFAVRNWADALRLQEHYEQAAEKFREAIGIGPEYPHARAKDKRSIKLRRKVASTISRVACGASPPFNDVQVLPT